MSAPADIRAAMLRQANHCDEMAPKWPTNAEWYAHQAAHYRAAVANNDRREMARFARDMMQAEEDMVAQAEARAASWRKALEAIELEAIADNGGAAHA